jgi:hypothetical protein
MPSTNLSRIFTKAGQTNKQKTLAGFELWPDPVTISLGDRSASGAGSKRVWSNWTNWLG